MSRPMLAACYSLVGQNPFGLKKQLLNHLKPHQAILRQRDFGMRQRARPNHVASDDLATVLGRDLTPLPAALKEILSRQA